MTAPMSLQSWSWQIFLFIQYNCGRNFCQMLVCGDLVYAQTWQVLTFICQYGLFCCMVLVSFRLFYKNLGNLQEFFGQMDYRPPGKKLPVRLWGNAWKLARKRTSWTSLNFSFKLSSFYLASISFTWLKFTCVNVCSQKPVSRNQALTATCSHQICRYTLTTICKDA